MINGMNWLDENVTKFWIFKVIHQGSQGDITGFRQTNKSMKNPFRYTLTNNNLHQFISSCDTTYNLVHHNHSLI